MEKVIKITGFEHHLNFNDPSLDDKEYLMGLVGIAKTKGNVDIFFYDLDHYGISGHLENVIQFLNFFFDCDYKTIDQIELGFHPDNGFHVEY